MIGGFLLNISSILLFFFCIYLLACLDQICRHLFFIIIQSSVVNRRSRKIVIRSNSATLQCYNACYTRYFTILLYHTIIALLLVLSFL